jgi:hypothetical protein
MPSFDFKCPQCGRVYQKVGVTTTTTVVYCDDHADHDVICVRLPAAPNFTIKGFSAKNGYSK